VISVITVNFNAGPILVKCVRSVLASTVPVEVLVVDNASTDGSLAALKQAVQGDGRVRIMENTANLGFASANNQALARATGDEVLFLNPDCLMGPETLAHMSRAMEGHPEAGMAGCLILNPDGTEQAGCRRSVPTPRKAFMRAFGFSRFSATGEGLLGDYLSQNQPLPDAPVEVEAISGAFMYVRRAALQQVGPLDEGYFMHCEDLDWCMRFRRAGWRILFVPGVSVVHDKGRCSRDRPVRVLWHMHRGMIRFYRKFFRHEYPAPLLWLVVAGVGIRFSLMATLTIAARSLAGKRKRETLLVISPADLERAMRLRGPSAATPRAGKAVVTGATGVVGHYLLPRLVERGFEVHALTRRRTPPRAPSGVTWHAFDIADGLGAWSLDDVTHVVHLAPLGLLPPLLPELEKRGVRRLIAFGSTSRFTKCDSTSRKERELASRLAWAEDALASSCAVSRIAWTLFRPTLIYGAGMDRNVSAIARFINRFGFFPMVGHGQGSRQPVHADDLAHMGTPTTSPAGAR
jgi:GT2 family glycosyltransferase